jgi:hypothetical protein
MKNFDQYEGRKKSLLDAYDTILGADLLPIEETGALQVQERRRDLEEGRFLVAVCGRIKAGKSTLLNALLFEDWVVPTDDLPLTAKNTLIEYGPVPSVEATFFSKQEWDLLVDELHAGDQKMAEEFFNEVSEAREHGVREAECILPQALVRSSANVGDLLQFVTPVSKGGIYTPFVKQVRLAYPHAWLRSVTIADTPGVDDPYKFREDQTKKFVTRAGAVLYVTYAGQAMAQQDFDFLNEYLIHVPPRRRLIAVNKSDTLKQGGDDVEGYLRSLMDSPEPAIRSVFGKRDSVRMVSALGSLIGRAVRDGRPLSEDNEYYRGLLDRTGHLEAGKNGIDALRDLVEERLVSDDGEAIINDHAQFLASLFERKRRLCMKQLSLRDEHLHDLGNTEERLKTQIGELRQQLEMVKAVLKKGETRIKSRSKATFSKLQQAFDAAWSTIIENVRNDLDDDTDIDGMGNRASWSFNTHFLAHRDELERALSQSVASLETALNDLGGELRAAWAGWHSAGYLETTLSYSLYDTLHSMRSVLSDAGSAQHLEKVREDSTIFYQRWFNTRGGRRAAASAIVQSLKDQLGPAMQAEYENVRRQLMNEVGEQLKAIAGQLEDVQKTRLHDLDRLTVGNADRATERETVLADIATIKADLAQLDKVKATIGHVFVA